MIKFKITNSDGDIVALVTVTDRGFPRRWYATDGDSEWTGRTPTKLMGLIAGLRHIRHRSRAWALGQYLQSVGHMGVVVIREWHRENQRMFTLEPNRRG